MGAGRPGFVLHEGSPVPAVTSAPSRPPALSVIVPAFNEESLLDPSIRALRAALDQCGRVAEIIIVDDGSGDRTGAIADSLSHALSGVAARHQANQGIGGAFRAGAAVASGDYVMLWPADMPATPEDLAPYIAKLGTADVIVGCRRHRLGYNPLMLLNSWIYPRLVSALFDLRVRDVNWIHVYRRTAFERVRLSQRGIPMLAEALVRLRDAGASFTEVDVVMKPRAGGVASASRVRVMARTLFGLFSFWRTWRREKR
jgi:glycosyltransferase involved in cell wall biosynthesis